VSRVYAFIDPVIARASLHQDGDASAHEHHYHTKHCIEVWWSKRAVADCERSRVLTAQFEHPVIAPAGHVEYNRQQEKQSGDSLDASNDIVEAFVVNALKVTGGQTNNGAQDSDVEANGKEYEGNFPQGRENGWVRTQTLDRKWGAIFLATDHDASCVYAQGRVSARSIRPILNQFLVRFRADDPFGTVERYGHDECWYQLERHPDQTGQCEYYRTHPKFLGEIYWAHNSSWDILTLPPTHGATEQRNYVFQQSCRWRSLVYRILTSKRKKCD